VAIALLVILAADACSTCRGRGRSSRSHEGPEATMLPPPPPPPPAHDAAPVQPPAPTSEAVTSRALPRIGDPAPPPAAGGRPKISLKQGMQKVSDSDLEGSLENWADGREIDLKHVIKRVGVFVTVAQDVRWDDAPKRATNTADYDRLVAESQSW